MLINRGSEVDEQRIEDEDHTDDHTQQYRTANDLFDIMTKDHELNAGDALISSDLVLLYKNLDVGSNILPDSSKITRKSNQHVETVVYEADQDSDESDTSEILNAENIDVYECNKERLDILNNCPSLKNSLCQKLGGIEMQSSNLNHDYRQHFNILQESYIKDQLNYSFGFEEFNGSVLPATLLDYICCKRLEDNYNFYMDNIIRYVKHTIDQLKRISNGDYLTDKAKEKWQEVIYPMDQSNNTKILATSTSIPLHIERKKSKHVTAWDDIVHSEVDVRSLSKILEKKIIVEVPKLMTGTYKLFSRHCADNLIISCKRETNPTIAENKEEDSRVDVVLQLGKSQSGQVVSNINSIIILKPQQDMRILDPLPLPYKVTEDPYFEENSENLDDKLQVMELDSESNVNDNPNSGSTIKHEDIQEFKSNDFNHQDTPETVESYDPAKNIKDLIPNIQRETLQAEASYEAILPEERPVSSLLVTSCTTPTSSPEECLEDVSSSTLIKKKSPTRIRIKSPYENQSHILEEKKRQRLLEIRERREKKKLALSENCKVSKHKYGKGGVLPQASNSVTKLSITNKSFYNSIYGQSNAVDQLKSKIRKPDPNNSIPEVPLDYEEDNDADALENKKYINRSYYLDDTVTEMMFMQMKQNKKSEITACSASTSVVSSDFRGNLTLLSPLIGPSVTDLNVKLNRAPSEEQSLSSRQLSIHDIKEENDVPLMSTSQSIINLAPANTPKNGSTGDLHDPKKTSSSLECRKSIDKIYDLMKRLEKVEGDEVTLQRNKLMAQNSDRVNFLGRQVSSTVQGSDSGTSVKHHLTSSDPSCFSFENPNIDIPNQKTSNKKYEVPVVPKVIISNKTQVQKYDEEKVRRPKKIIVNPAPKTQDNPLKAISQLLHEFESVQKGRQKTIDVKANKKNEYNKLLEVNNDVKRTSFYSSSKRRSRLELHLKETEVLGRPPKIISPRNLSNSLGLNRTFRQQAIAEDHDKITKRKITDIIDEVKEARGEAVKGPSKFNSRLNSLAQPKKSYMQARIEGRPTRSVKTLPDKQPKMAPVSQLSERNMGSANAKNKAKKIGTEAISSVSVKQPTVQPLDEAVNVRRSVNDKPEPLVSTSKRNNVPSTPKTLKKMVAVESYVKNHYRRAPPSSPVRDRSLAGHRSRIPLLPDDIELASMTSGNTAEESTEFGSRLHNIINTMLEVPPGLTVLSEVAETACEKSENSYAVDDLCRGDEKSSIGSDYPVDVFEDKLIVTAVEDVSKGPNTEQLMKDDSQIFKSATEIPKLQNSLYCRWPVGAFQKRLRIKNLTLTPKHSLKQVFVLQSGDGGSLVIKSSVSKTLNLDLDTKMQDLNALPVLSKTELDWNFSNFPMQIATVGYAFPQYQSPFKSNTKTKSLVDMAKAIKQSNIALSPNKDSRLFGDHLKPVSKDTLDNCINTDKPSIPALYNKPDEGKTDSINNFVEVVAKSNEKNKIATSQPSEGRSKPVQELELKNIDYTTSLDILVGLLNEIQKITSCQTNITNNNANEQQRQELEVILDDAAALEALSKESPKELVSIASLDKLRQLESSPSMYTLYLSSDDDNEKENKSLTNITTEAFHPLYIDKEVSVMMDSRECINRFTDVPSIFPMNINHSTNITNSLMGVLSQPSSQSVFSCMEYQTLYSNTSFNTYKQIIQLPQHIKEETKIIPKHRIMTSKEKGKLNENNDVVSLKFPQRCEKSSKKMNQKLVRCTKIVGNVSDTHDFDPMLRMKRDILVTVYSILVFTVFAALSFPEVLYPV